MTTTLDELLTQPRPVAPFPLVRMAGPLPLAEARLLATLIDQRSELEALLQDDSYWESYAARTDSFAALDHRVCLRDQVTKLGQRIYQLQNPGAPTLKEQGHAYAAARKAEADTKAAKKSSIPNLLSTGLGLAVAYLVLFTGMAGGMALFIHVWEAVMPPPAAEVSR